MTLDSEIIYSSLFLITIAMALLLAIAIPAINVLITPTLVCGKFGLPASAPGLVVGAVEDGSVGLVVVVGGSVSVVG